MTKWYHGCTLAVAQLLISGEQSFRISENEYDWLGNGAYFWEDAPVRAREWAERLFGDEGAVISANINLGLCLNLLDTEHFAGLEFAYQKAILNLNQRSLPIPENKSKRHFLDRAVIEFYCRDFVQIDGRHFQTVRGCFPEGRPLYPGSKILRETHIQVAVRDLNCISNLTLVKYE